MGTNYYLRRKCEFDPLRGTPASLGCPDWAKREPLRLDDGWAWNGRHYPDLESLNEDFYQEMHIGKSSAGWRFLLATYPKRNPKNAGEIWLDRPIEGLGDWIELFDDPRNEIVDECGGRLTPERMIDVIASREGDPGLEDGWRTLGGIKRFASGGLLTHAGDPYCAAMGGGRTYDLALSGNDPSCGLVFC